MNYLVCTVFVIGTLTAGHTIRFKRGIPDETFHENQIQHDIAGSSQIDGSGYGNGQGGYDNGQGGYLNGQGGYDNGQAGYDNGQGGYDNGQGGYDNGQGGYDNGQGGYATDGISQDVGSTSQGKISHVTITKEVPIHHPVPVPVEVEKKVPYPIYVNVPVPVDRPYYVKIQRPYLVPVYKDVPYAVYRDVPVPVKVAVEVPYPVRVPVLVPQPYPIPIDVPVKVPVPDVKVIKRPVVLEQQERENGGGDVVSEANGALDVEIGGRSDGIGIPQEITDVGGNDTSDVENGSAVEAGDIGEKH